MKAHCQIPINNGVDWPAKIFGALGLVMIAVGLVPPYIDIYKERRVRGFSFIFLMIDMGGAFFSLLSLCIAPFNMILLTIQFLNNLIHSRQLYTSYSTSTLLKLISGGSRNGGRILSVSLVLSSESVPSEAERSEYTKSRRTRRAPEN